MIENYLSLRRAGVAAGLVSASCIVFLFCLELGLRLFDPQIYMPHPNGMWQLSPTRGSRLTPSFDGYHWYREFNVRITISPQGLRDRTFGPKEPGTYRILALGDSFTFGFGVEGHEAYPKQLETLLAQEEAAVNYEVVNAGFPGYGTLQELRYLEEEGLQLQPDLVLIGVFPFNDITDNLKAPNRYTLVNGYLYDRDGYEQALEARSNQEGGLPIPYKEWLWSYSHSYRFLADRYRRLRAGNATESQPERDTGAGEPPAPPANQTLSPSAADQKFFDNTSGYLAEVIDTVRAHNAVPVMMLIPDIMFISGKENRWSVMWAMLKTFARDRDVPVIDFVPSFRRAYAAQQSDTLWYPVNKHWNAAGHRMAAEVIYNELILQKLLPTSGDAGSGENSIHGQTPEQAR